MRVACEEFGNSVPIYIVSALGVFILLQTDTASVLLEAIGYIRFLQNQIEVTFTFFHAPY